MVTKEQMMGSWKQIVGGLKEKFGDFTNDELKRVEGNVEQLVGLVQQKTGESKEAIMAFIDQCCGSAEQSVHRIASQASKYAEYAGEAIRDNYDRVASEAQKGYDCTMKAVSRRPLESVAIAVGAGVLAGMAIGISMAARRR